MLKQTRYECTLSSLGLIQSPPKIIVTERDRRPPTPPVIEPTVIVHGGAADFGDELMDNKMAGVKLAARIGYKILHGGGSVVDAVQAAVESMEKDPAFNAGHGSVLTVDGTVEMEACIQRGSDQNVGSVAIVKDINHPVTLARKVMEDSPHSFLAGEGAKKFAVSQKFEIVDPKSLVSKFALEAHKELNLASGGVGRREVGDHKNFNYGSVGAIAIDAEGHVAVAGSSGGRNGKYAGRIGETSLIGTGCFAKDGAAAVSATGHGESIIKKCLANSIVSLIELEYSALDATMKVLKEMKKSLKTSGGAITVNHVGDIAIYFTSPQMPWSYVRGSKLHFGMEEDESDEEDYESD